MEPELPPFIEPQTQESDVLHPPGIILGMLENRRNRGLGGRFLHRSNLLCETTAPNHITVIWGCQGAAATSAMTAPSSVHEVCGLQQ
jgi:hypothetical protein